MSHTEPSQKYLALKDGRTIAYAESGDLNSSTLVIFFHGLFAVGNASRPSPVLLEKQVHFLAPTLPGWGESSTVPRSSTFTSCLIEDMNALITYLHPDTSKLKLYICGGSYGTVAAQILYGAPYDVFPVGRQIVGLLLMATFSPFRLDPNYQKSLTWSSYIGVGPPAHKIPFNLIPRIVKLAFSFKLSTVEGAEKFIRSMLFDEMDSDEQRMLAEWCDSREVTKDVLIREWSEGVIKSVERTWDGFLDVCKVLHGDWGYSLPLDDEHSKAQVLVVAATQDYLGLGMAEFLVQNYKNARLKIIEGSHIAGLFHSDRIWAEFVV